MTYFFKKPTEHLRSLFMCIYGSLEYKKLPFLYIILRILLTFKNARKLTLNLINSPENICLVLNVWKCQISILLAAQISPSFHAQASSLQDQNESKAMLSPSRCYHRGRHGAGQLQPQSAICIRTFCQARLLSTKAYIQVSLWPLGWLLTALKSQKSPCDPARRCHAVGCVCYKDQLGHQSPTPP